MDDSADTPRWPDVDVSVTPDTVALPAPDENAFDTGYPAEPDAAVATGGRDEAPWPDQTGSILPADLQAPIPDESGVPAEKRQIEGHALGWHTGRDITGSTDHDRTHHDRTHPQGHAATPPAAAGKHAGFSAGIRTLAALFTPTPPRQFR